jgi:hypothetical protein
VFHVNAVVSFNFSSHVRLDGIHRMRQAEQFARLFQDACRAVPPQWRHAAIGATGAAALALLVGTALPGTTLKAAPTATASGTPERPCREQTWPNLSGACLQQPDAATGSARHVRVIPLDRDSPNTVYVYAEAPKAAPAKTKRPAASQDARTEGRSQRTNQRRVAPQRETAPSRDAYQTYGAGPRAGWRQ